jgi:hypothetical protein
MTALTVPAGRIRVGDDLLFLGKPHRITEILPYPRNRQFDAPKWRIARDAYGWEITLIPGQHHDVVRA